MYYHNMNQINRMKIRKNEFQQNLSTSALPEIQIEKVIYPFIPQMVSRKIDLYVARIGKIPKQSILADWNNYKLILFNVIQNAVKYNSENGTILILLSLKNRQSTNEHELETEVIDTGIGISEDRQKMLFKPFLELKMKQNFD